MTVAMLCLREPSLSDEQLMMVATAIAATLECLEMECPLQAKSAAESKMLCARGALCSEPGFTSSA